MMENKMLRSKSFFEEDGIRLSCSYFCRKGIPEVWSNNIESMRTSFGFMRARSNKLSHVL